MVGGVVLMHHKVLQPLHVHVVRDAVVAVLLVGAGGGSTRSSVTRRAGT